MLSNGWILTRSFSFAMFDEVTTPRCPEPCSGLRWGDMSLRSLICLLSTVLGLVACAEETKSPSRVDSTRILGLKATPSNPAPGDTLSLELLWADPEPFCSGEGTCEPGRSCRGGRCVREAETEILWIAVPIAAWEPTDLASLEVDEFTCVMDRCPPPIPCTDDAGCPYDGGCVDGFCVPCLSFGPVTVCCGTRNVRRIQLEVPPELTPPPPDCSPDTSINTDVIYQVQAQICAGGRIDLCPDPEALTFACEGEGAASATATSRIEVVADPAEANLAPAVHQPIFSLSAWEEGEVIEVRGCVDGDCSDRRCDGTGDCESGQICWGSLCREEIILGMGEGATEVYLNPCDEPESCQEDSDCPMQRVCQDGLCHRIEVPFTGFFATAGWINPARDLLDEDGDGRPDQDRVYTTWLPPPLDACGESDAPCTFGRCDPESGRCTGEVDFWVVVRDGRGGQDWIERTLRIVP